MANLVTFAKKLWKDKVGGNTPITAAELNRMEGGINDCATQINKLGDSVSRSMGELPSTNLDEIKSSGVYQIVDNVTNGAPSSANRWGFLIVFSASPSYVMQVIFGDASGTVFFRDLWGANGWRSWRKMVAENA